MVNSANPVPIPGVNRTHKPRITRSSLGQKADLLAAAAAAAAATAKTTAAAAAAAAAVGLQTDAQQKIQVFKKFFSLHFLSLVSLDSGVQRIFHPRKSLSQDFLRLLTDKKNISKKVLSLVFASPRASIVG